jgi:hypothetical protein
MKHIREFEGFTVKRKLSELIKESVMIMGDTYKVRISAELDQKFINSIVKRVKDNAGTDIRRTFSDSDMAEEIVKYVVSKGLTDPEQIPSSVFIGGQAQVQAQPEAQVAQAEAEAQPEAPVQEVPEVQPAQVEAQPAQVEAQPAQTQSEDQSQPEAQQTEENDFEEVKEETPEGEEETEEEKAEGEETEEDKEDEEELPI